MVAAAATTPLWGKLGDRHGRKRLLEVALGLFLAASALCGLAQDITELDRRARRAGRGRRRADGARHGRRRRPRLAARARPLPGLHRRGVRRGHRRRAAARRRCWSRARAGAGSSTSTCRSASSPWPACGCVLPAARRERRARAARPGRRRPAGRRHERAHARLHLGRRALRLGLVRRSLALAARAALRRRAGGPGAARGRPDRAARAAAHARRGGRQRRPCSWRPPRCSPSRCSCRCSSRRPPAPRRPRRGCCWCRSCSGSRVATTLAGRSVARTGRYKRFPVAGLALMAAALVLLAVVAGDPSRADDRGGLVVFGLGFGMVGQMLITAVQNSVERRGWASPRPRRVLPRPRRRRGRRHAGRGLRRARGRGRGPRSAGAVQTVFLAGAGLAAARPGRRPRPARGATARPRPSRRRRGVTHGRTSHVARCFSRSSVASTGGAPRRRPRGDLGRHGRGRCGER